MPALPVRCLPEKNAFRRKSSRITSSTIEMLDMEQHYDIAVIDEAQMIADRDRGHPGPALFWE